MKRARLMMIISMTIFGTIGLFVRRISVSSGELALYRAVLALVLLTGYLLVTKQRIPFEKIKREIPLLLFPVWLWASTGFCCLKHTNILLCPWRH